jgi:hypothetical protein
MFIKKLKTSSDLDRIHSDFNKIVDLAGWGDRNQIGLNRRCGSENIWFDAAGSLYDSEISDYISDEHDYIDWNIDSSWYVRQQIERLESEYNFRCGRVRFMLLKPKTGLTVHSDRESRYHLVLKTNPFCYVAHTSRSVDLKRSQLPSAANCYHLPADGSWYCVDTREQHWVYNGGHTDRIHLVVCG